MGEIGNDWSSAICVSGSVKATNMRQEIAEDKF